MRKKLYLLSAMAMMVSVTACSTGGQTMAATEEITRAEVEMQTESNTESGTVPGENTAAEDNNILIAYFSLWGNVDYPENVDATTSASITVGSDGRFGTTEFAANTIQELTGGDVYLIQTEEKYSADFDEVVTQNHEEMDQGTLPALVSSPLNMEDYDVIFIGYPIWATNAPQAIHSFLTEYDLTDKTVIPFCTHDGYGAGRSYSTIAELCPQAEVLEGLAIEANDVPGSQDTIKQWVEQLNVSNGLFDGAAPSVSVETGETAIRITIGDLTLDGVLYDNEEARQFISMLPQSISMVGYGGREFYGGLEGEIQTVGNGQYSFENGDITYCPSNNTAAIFYAQTEQPNLTMEVFPMGKVTSDLSAFNQLQGNVEITFSLAE